MRKSLLCLLLCLMAGLASQAQFRVTGSLRDTTARSYPANASVALLQKKDSTLVTFTRTDASGHFRIREVAPGAYVLLITFPKFADLAEVVEVKDKDVDMGELAITPKSRLLQEVIIRTAAAIRIKGDTTEFTADSFHVKEGATVEDLLKRLPGFSVNAKGEITTQGKRVDKVLVDGEEFFGDDPTMATQNLSAKIVDKVQVFDTKSEQENLRNVGSAEGKTLNIKLKEDKKRGGFGNVQVGTDFNRFLEARTMFNRFVGKKKVSVYANRSNVNTGSLNWGDKNKLGMDNNVEYDELNGYYYSFNNDDGFSDWNLKGYPDAWTGGALYVDKWDRERQNINLSYRFNQLGNANTSITTTKYLGLNRTRAGELVSNGTNRQHVINTKYEWKIDSLASIKYTVGATFRNSETGSVGFSYFQNDNGDTLSTNSQVKSNRSERKQLDQQLVYRQAFMKKGRLALLTLRHGLVEDMQRGMNRFEDRDLTNGTDSLVDQMRNIDGQSRSFGVKASFNEPLSKVWNMVMEYGYNNNKSESYRNTFNKSNNGKYETLDTVYSNNFELGAFSHNGSLTFKYVDKKWRAALGTGVSAVTLRLHNLFAATNNTYRFLNMTPQVGVNFSPKPQANINFSYRGNTRQPTIDQLQPIRDNNNSTNVFLGNPDLKVGFTNSFNLGYNRSRPLKSTWMYVSLSYNISSNDIAYKNEIDVRNGKQTYQPVNVNGNRNWWAWANWSKDAGNKKWSRGIQAGGNGGRRINFVNGDRNVTNYGNVNFNPNISYRWDDHFNFQVGPQVAYNISKSTSVLGSNNNYFTYGGNAEASVTLPFKVQLNVEATVDIRGKVNGFTGTPNNYLVNGSLTRSFFKDKSLLLKMTVNDLLNQNVGFNRDFDSNIINEERYNRIARYFMLRLEWSFNKMGTSASK